MSAETLLCFGGPKDGELLTIDRPRDVVLCTQPPDLSRYLAGAVDEPIVTPEPFRYNVEKVFLHDDRRCMGFPDYHDEWCMMTARCLVAQSYPKHQITDTLTALAQLVSVARFLPWVSGDQEGTSG